MNLEITSVDAPEEAAAGETVNVSIYAYNRTAGRIFAIATADCNGTGFVTYSYWVEPNRHRAFGFSFIMPSGDVIIWCWVWEWTGAGWAPNSSDEYGPVVVRLAGAPPPEYTGRIGVIHVNDHPIPQTLSYGDDFRIQFRGYLDSGERVRLWARVKVESPGGRIIYDHSAIEAPLGTGVGGSHPFGFPTFVPYQSPITIDESGEWEATIELRAGGATGPILATERDVHIITVPEVVEPEYDGEITKVQCRTGVHNWVLAPLSLEQGDNFSVAVTVVNRSSIALVLNGAITVISPSGQEQYRSDSTGIEIPPIEDSIAPGESHTFKWNDYGQLQAFNADEAGIYTARFVLKGKKKGEPDSAFQQLCDPWEGKVATVAQVEEPEYELVKEETYPWAYSYWGAAEVCTWTFKLPPEQLPGIDWLTEKLVTTLASTLEDNNSKLLTLKLWRDTTPVMWTDYKCEVTASASPLAWYGILAIVAAAIVAVAFLIRTINSVFWETEGLPEATKEEFSRETLTSMIIDLAPETPPATLEGLTDAELRTMLNQLLAAKEEEPSPWSIIIDIMPLIMIMMVFSMMIPMTKELGAGE